MLLFFQLQPYGMSTFTISPADSKLNILRIKLLSQKNLQFLNINMGGNLTGKLQV